MLTKVNLTVPIIIEEEALSYRQKTDSPSLKMMMIASLGLDPDSSRICFLSWNSRGSSDQKLNLMYNLVQPDIIGDCIPILCNQENFLLKPNVYKLLQTLPEFHFFINPGPIF